MKLVSFTLETFQALMLWLKGDFANMVPMSTTLATFQDPISWSKNFASPNMAFMDCTLATFQEPMSWLKVDSENISFYTRNIPGTNVLVEGFCMRNYAVDVGKTRHIPRPNALVKEKCSKHAAHVSHA
jgi:hypothetical protein